MATFDHVTINPDRDPVDIRGLIDAQMSPFGKTGSTRKHSAGVRRRIMCETFEEDVASIVHSLIRSEHVRDRVSRHITPEFNLGLDIVTAENVIYKSGVGRRLKKGKKGHQKAMAAMNEESRLDALAPMLNRWGAFVGPMLEVPRVMGGKLRRKILAPDDYDVILDGNDPLGMPRAAAWSESHTDRQRIFALDPISFAEYDLTGKQISSVDHGVVDPITGKPAFPGTIWRYDQPFDARDWWVSQRENGLTKATINIGFWMSMLGWIRKAQNRKLMYLFGNLTDLPNGLMSDAEVPVMQHIKKSEPIQPQIGAIDLNTDPKFFADQIMITVRAQVGRRGILQINFDYGGDVVPAMALAMQHERLSEGRNRQKPFAREIEKSSAWKATAICKNMGHPNASAMAEPKEIHDRFVLEIPELNRVEEPKNWIILKDWELSRGLTTDADIERSRNPDLTLEEAQAVVIKRLERQAELNEIKSRNNMSGNDPMLTAAQANGAQGPAARDGGAETPGENDNGPESRPTGSGAPGTASPGSNPNA